MLQPAYSCMCQIIDVFIAASIRTPLGSFNGSLASVSAIKLGSIAVEGEEHVMIETCVNDTYYLLL